MVVAGLPAVGLLVLLVWDKVRGCCLSCICSVRVLSGLKAEVGASCAARAANEG